MIGTEHNLHPSRSVLEIIVNHRMSIQHDGPEDRSNEEDLHERVEQTLTPVWSRYVHNTLGLFEMQINVELGGST